MSVVSHGLKILSLLLGALLSRAKEVQWILGRVVCSVLVPKCNQNFHSRPAVLHWKLTCCYQDDKLNPVETD